MTIVAATMSTSFNRVYESFRRRLTPDLSNKFQYATVEDLKDAIEEIQSAQAQRNSLRNLNKIKHFLHGLEQYAGVLEVFVQVKPAILGLIWVCCILACSIKFLAHGFCRVQLNSVFKYALVYPYYSIQLLR